MAEMDIKHHIHLLQKEVEAAISLIEDVKLNLVSGIDTLRIEIEVLKKFMERYHPDFPRFYSSLREELIRELDPEWMEGGSREKKAATDKES